MSRGGATARDLLACLTALAVLGIAQQLVAVAWAAGAILLLMAAVTHPRRVAALVAGMGALVLAFRAPAATAGAVALVATASAVTGHILRSRNRPTTPVPLEPVRALLPPPSGD